ncbi:MAG: bifunctional DNA primase/polymerase [Hyphomicrobiales bacterium]|nr:bifunctional DNA primase/polymerase [Hyphomicrobiales bacterium]
MNRPLPTRLAVARNLAERGLHLFPVKRNGKAPAISAWQEKATTDEGMLSRWFGTGNPHNIGIATGKKLPDGRYLLVVDLDCKRGVDGEANLRALVGELAVTFTVGTPSGGKHLYFAASELVKSTAGVLAPGVDIRCRGGLVVGPGSTIDGRPYRVLHNTPLASAPAALIDVINATATAAKPVKLESSVELDTPAALAVAETYIEEAAPSIEGQGGNDRAYKTAAHLRDLGISEWMAATMMLGTWNKRCEPEWSPEELDTICRNAYAYGQNSPGSASAAAEFDVLRDADIARIGKPAIKSVRLHPIEQFAADALPRRRWVLGRLLMRNKLSVLVSPGGVGKSTLALAAAVSVATGRDLLDMTVYEPGHAIVVNNEDDEEEMLRRLAAVLQRFKVAWGEIEGRLTIYSGASSQRFLVARRVKGGQLRVAPDVEMLTRYCLEHRAAAVFVDPLVETHEADENDNVDINLVARLYRDIAMNGDTALMLVHHSRKPPQAASSGHAGNADSSRGASALPNASRITATLYGMDQADAKIYGVPEDKRFRFMRLDDGKLNFSLSDGKPSWFEKESVRIGNGDEVGVAVPIRLIERETNIEAMALKLVCALLAEGGGSVALHTASERLADDTVLELSQSTARRKLVALLKDGAYFDGWRIWVEGDGNQQKTIRGERDEGA